MSTLEQNIPVDTSERRTSTAFESIHSEIQDCMRRDIELAEEKGEGYERQIESNKAFNRDRINMIITTARYELFEISEEEMGTLLEALKRMGDKVCTDTKTVPVESGVAVVGASEVTVHAAPNNV